MNSCHNRNLKAVNLGCSANPYDIPDVAYIGVRDLVARGYFIPGGVCQRGVGGQAPMFPCRTLSDLDYPGLRSVTCDVSSRWVLTTVQ